METLPKCRHYDSFKTMWNVENYIKRALFVVERKEWLMKMTKHRLRTEENQDGDDCFGGRGGADDFSANISADYANGGAAAVAAEN